MLPCVLPFPVTTTAFMSKMLLRSSANISANSASVGGINVSLESSTEEAYWASTTILLTVDSEYVLFDVSYGRVGIPRRSPATKTMRIVSEARTEPWKEAQQTRCREIYKGRIKRQELHYESLLVCQVRE